MVESIFLAPWVWIMPIIILLTLTLFVVGYRLAMKSPYGADSGLIPISTLSLMFTIGLSAWYFAVLLPPYDASFYQTYRVTGEVTQIESVDVPDGEMMKREFVIRVDGVDDYIRSTDVRLLDLSVGDEANLVCTKQFEYFVQPWYSCSLGSNGVDR